MYIIVDLFLYVIKLRFSLLVRAKEKKVQINKHTQHNVYCATNLFPHTPKIERTGVLFPGD